MPPLGRIAAVDYGDVRIGLAITDPERTIASPLENHTRRGELGDRRYFEQLARTEEVAMFVVGLPVHLDGRESQKSRAARAFGEWLTKTTGVPVTFYDERFTTREAEEILREAQVKGKQRKERLDMLAAQILLKAYLDNPSGMGDAPEALDDR
jgi:putative Holliday junction resolvase